VKLFIRRLSFFSGIIFSLTFQSIQSSTAKQVQISTLSAARFAVIRIINQFPQNVADVQKYEKEQCNVLLQCAKVLYDNARTQILGALLEIDNRIAYWQYQKDHQWQYFVSKSPLKWVKGPKQEEEITDNLETLKSHQGELYVLLGQLSELGNVFTQGYKDTFVTDYTKCYEWIDALLNALSRIQIDRKRTTDKSPFLARVKLLKEQLHNVEKFKVTLVSDIAETNIPTHLARNWLRYGGFLFGLRYSYLHADPIGEALSSYFHRTSGYLMDVMMPVKQLFFPTGGLGMLLLDEGSLKQTRTSMEEFLTKLEQNKVIDQEEKDIIIADEARGSTAAFQKMFDEKIKSAGYWRLGKYGAEAGIIRGELMLQHLLMRGEKEIAGMRNIALLTPAVITAGLAYLGYQRLTTPQYSPIRKALVDINSLFVDQSKDLTDEQYGKMIYLIYKLKKQAQKDLPVKDNVQSDFISDLERIESKEFNVAAKRAIIDDMFKKYTFLGLIQSK